MKKIFVLILALMFVFVFVSCTETETGSSSSSSNSSESAAPSDSNGDNESDGSMPDTPPESGEQIGPGGTVGSADSSDNSENTGNSDDNSGETTDGSNNTTQSSGTTDSSDDNQGEIEDTEPAESVENSVIDALGDAMKPFDADNTYGNEGIISSYTSYTAEFDLSTLKAGERVQILQGGIFRVYGKCLDGQIYINANDQNVILLLDGVDLSSSSSAVPIFAEKCKSVQIVLAEGSVNRLEDSGLEGENGVIKVKSCNLTLDGKGRLTIKANGENGISNTKEMTINGGTYVITSKKHGVYGKQGVTVNGGMLIINSARSGIKSGDDEPGKEELGQITINKGSIQIRCNTDGLNSYGPVSITDGYVVLEAKSRGIDATQNVTISGGTVIFSTENDAIRVPKTVYIFDKNDPSKITGTDSEGYTVSIEGTACVKIATYGNGIQAEKVSVSTKGVLYINTVLHYVEDVAGTYKKENGEYILIAEGEKYNGTKYNPLECKGIEARTIEIKGTVVGIDSYEDCLNAVNVSINNCVVALATTKDAIEASSDHKDVTCSITIEGVATYVTVISADKGFKAVNTTNRGSKDLGFISLSEGTTKIFAVTDALKADRVTVSSGRHILFDKVESKSYTQFIVMDGTVLCFSTTTKPVSVVSDVTYVSGVIENKEMCTNGQKVSISFGDTKESIILPKDYTEKLSILYVNKLIDGECTVTVGDSEQVLENN